MLFRPPLVSLLAVNKLFDIDGVEFKSHQSLQDKPFDAPGDRKVALIINARHLHVTRGELKVLKKIAHPRFDVATNTLKLVSSRHETVTENKRELLELLHRLISESKTIVKELAPPTLASPRSTTPAPVVSKAEKAVAKLSARDSAGNCVMFCRL
jgi:hypothetical protein